MGNAERVVHIVKYSMPDLRVTFISSQKHTVNSLFAITARKFTKMFKRELGGLIWLDKENQFLSTSRCNAK